MENPENKLDTIPRGSKEPQFITYPRQAIPVPHGGARLSLLWKSGSPSHRETKEQHHVTLQTAFEGKDSSVQWPSPGSSHPHSSSLSLLPSLHPLPFLPSFSFLFIYFPTSFFSFSSPLLPSNPSPCAASQMAATSPKGRRPALTLGLA